MTKVRKIPGEFVVIVDEIWDGNVKRRTALALSTRIVDRPSIGVAVDEESTAEEIEFAHQVCLSA